MPADKEQPLWIGGGEEVRAAIPQPLFRAAIVTVELESSAATADEEIDRLAALRFKAAPWRIRSGLEHRLVGLRPTGERRRQRQRRTEPGGLPGRIWPPYLPA